MDDGRWTMDDGRWTMDDGRWTMDDGRWTMDDGRWTMDDGRWTMDDGRWTMDSVVCAIVYRPSSIVLYSRFVFAGCVAGVPSRVSGRRAPASPLPPAGD